VRDLRLLYSKVRSASPWIRTGSPAPQKKLRARLKNAIGKVTGDGRLQANGKADKSKGKLQNTTGGAKDAVRDALKK
jgi:uncharacterized protein YjbJ (UPF0337 family)